MPPKPRKIPKANILGLTFSVLISLSILLPDAIQAPVMMGLVLVLIVAFNYFLRHP